ncbi:hypothetical protein KL930_001848 [Ogataea haglerorum]|uniref:Cytochrome b5 heme-binding domain-containing protein n=1 Tax=Ogataea haglerorum TaxID=1937702 RepID=A0AAN6DA03_9ASCO|nr:hypothetical protein KL915_001903 [Ogataea haglerorum]KAG7721186.1 hypothetical protein KL913_000922 [Ogataea haglerorum]KAG7721940.1 hypothetical protein KL949_000918 [Ogataea haglerorum]KAG7730052.1 hypothetical protein KL933_001132 [Ogataea haglerorum]KAG7744403.1 hypothetical protein KL932_000919 [Ogataea haglerorum]
MGQSFVAPADPGDSKSSVDSSPSGPSVSGRSSVQVSSQSSPASVMNLQSKLSPNELEEMDTDVEAFLQVLERTEAQLHNAKVVEQPELEELIQMAKQTVLRLNLNKNLVKYQLRSNMEEYATERQLLLKNIANIEKNIHILQNENECINMKNLKLIKSLKTLKNDKVKALKAENALLRKQIQDQSTRSPTMLDALGRLASHYALRCTDVISTFFYFQPVVAPQNKYFSMETLVLIAIVVILATFLLKSTIFAPPRTVEINPERDDVAVEEQEFTPRTLYKYNGFDLEQIYIAVKGNVYDVSKSRQFYGPSGPYSNFAGHDASRGLAKNSFDECKYLPFVLTNK